MHGERPYSLITWLEWGCLFMLHNQCEICVLQQNVMATVCAMLCCGWRMDDKWVVLMVLFIMS